MANTMGESISLRSNPFRPGLEASTRRTCYPKDAAFLWPPFNRKNTGVVDNLNSSVMKGLRTSALKKKGRPSTLTEPPVPACGGWVRSKIYLVVCHAKKRNNTPNKTNRNLLDSRPCQADTMKHKTNAIEIANRRITRICSNKFTISFLAPLEAAGHTH